ncbi:MAG: group III truncated hemoglobin [Beijerinckiaceae bacterium]|nr:group III truncated hemoglobin [Beijerinckiaceae bacterium]
MATPHDDDEGRIDEALLRALIGEFYARVRRDRELGPVFEAIIADRWPPHIEKILSFWMTATRAGAGYKGRDFTPAHLRHSAIRAAQLPRWLELFRATCADLCEPQAAVALIRIAEQMADNLQISLSRRDADA